MSAIVCRHCGGNCPTEEMVMAVNRNTDERRYYCSSECAQSDTNEPA